MYLTPAFSDVFRIGCLFYKWISSKSTTPILARAIFLTSTMRYVVEMKGNQDERWKMKKPSIEAHHSETMI